MTMDRETRELIKNFERFFKAAGIPLKRKRRKKIELKAYRMQTKGIKKEDYRQ